MTVKTDVKGMQPQIPAPHIHIAGMHVTLFIMPIPLTEISLG